MEQNIQQPATELSPGMRGSAPADLHAYRRGRRMSRDADSAPGRMQNIRESLRNVDEQRLATALGWFSVALGLAEVMAPRQLGQAIGTRANPALLRAMGLREIASGVGILTRPQRAGWLWSRVAGDAIDLALLGTAMGSGRTNRGRLVAATAAVVGVTALDIYCSQHLTRNGAGTAMNSATEPVRETIIVNASAEACYRMWRDFERFPRFMKHVESVRASSQDQWHWVVKAPGGGTVEWDARITSDEPSRLLAWETLPGADVQNSGMVRFEEGPGGRGTKVRVEMSYVPPAGPIGAVAAKVTGEAPGQQVREDLRRFKQIIETGEIATTDGQPAGRRGMVHSLFKRERSK